MAGLFALAAVWIAAARSFGRLSGDRIWRVYAVELGIVGAILVPAYLGGAWLLAALLLIGAACTVELQGALEKRGELPLRRTGLALGGVAVGVGTQLPAALPGVLAGAALLALGLRAARARLSAAASPLSPLRRAESTLFGVLYPGLCLGHFAALAGMPGGFGYAMFCFALTEVGDAAGYLVGASLGRRRIYPGLSPNKTAAGAVGGALATVSLALGLGFLTPGLGTGERLGAGLLLALAGPAGDLFASHIKRRAGVKDFGNAVPTQGGVLDVYDSLILVAPIYYYYLHAVV